MTGAPQSTSARYRLPACIVALLLAAAPTVGSQLPARRAATQADFAKEPGGTVLVRVAKDASLVPTRTRGTWQEATLDGWIAAAALRNDGRDGFDVAVNLGAGTAIRSGPGSGAIIGTAVAGALFQRVEARGGWVHVRRTGWLPARALPPADPAGSGRTQAPATTSARAPAATSMAAGATLSAILKGSPVATFESPYRAEIVERRDGWSRVRIEGWVRDQSLSDSSMANQVSGADVRDNPERYVGQTVEWTLQVLAVQQADELRPELPAGQPYVLARGPLPETGFVYLVIGVAEVARFRDLEPLAKVRVRATIRSGRTRFLPTPVLNFVRRLD